MCVEYNADKPLELINSIKESGMKVRISLLCNSSYVSILCYIYIAWTYF